MHGISKDRGTLHCSPRLCPYTRFRLSSPWVYVLLRGCSRSLSHASSAHHPGHVDAQGDAKALATAKKEFGDSQRRLERLAADVYKFQLYLSAIDGTAPPAPPSGYKAPSPVRIKHSMMMESHVPGMYS